MIDFLRKTDLYNQLILLKKKKRKVFISLKPFYKYKTTSVMQVQFKTNNLHR